MRSKKSLYNMITSVCSYGIAIVLGIITQSIFTKVVGLEYLGINGLFDNILSMLAIAEMGVGTAIICNLYKPIHDNDIEKVKSLMGFYKISYRVIGIIVFIVGIAVIPFLPNLVGEVHIEESLNLLYCIALADIIASYFLAYKRSLLYAHQNESITNIVHIVYLLIMNITLIFILVVFKNYILYLVIKLIYRIIENVVISKIVDKQYPYVKEKYKPLDKNIKTEIFKKVKGMFVYKISSFIISGTDNIIISKYLGIKVVGLYSNYSLITNSISRVLSQFFGSITASVGDLLTEGDREKAYGVYKKVLFLNFWLSTFSAITFLCLVQPFIKIFFGEQYILPLATIIILAIYLFIDSIRKSTTIFKEAAGIYNQDKYVSVLQAIINIVVSIILVKIIGLPGVFIGTIVSQLLLIFYGYPKYILKPLFKIKYSKSIMPIIKYAIIAFFLGCINYFICGIVHIQNNMILLIYSGICCAIIPNVCIYMLFRKTEEFKYYKNFIMDRLKKKQQLEKI